MQKGLEGILLGVLETFWWGVNVVICPLRLIGSVIIEARMAQKSVSWKYYIFNVQKLYVLSVQKSMCYELCVILLYLKKIVTVLDT